MAILSVEVRLKSHARPNLDMTNLSLKRDRSPSYLANVRFGSEADILWLALLRMLSEAVLVSARLLVEVHEDPARSHAAARVRPALVSALP